jgi:hypothetical protein
VPHACMPLVIASGSPLACKASSFPPLSIQDVPELTQKKGEDQLLFSRHHEETVQNCSKLDDLNHTNSILIEEDLKKTNVVGGDQMHHAGRQAGRGEKKLSTLR